MILAFDLGTGGNKTTLHDLDGQCLAASFIPYSTYFPGPGRHEQRPQDWWQAVVQATRAIFEGSRFRPEEVVAIGVSGHSLGVIPLDRSGKLLKDRIPIWSDSRADQQAKRFFQRVPENEWYRITGNGFPPPLYSLFKILWYQENEPEMFEQIAHVIGTKDYINYRLCGAICTDYSYASGCGVYSLLEWGYSSSLVAASGLPQHILPEILPSSQVIGRLNRESSIELGLPPTVQVVAGGVDNSCMALGARNLEEGQVYNSQGSSSWIAVTSKNPLLDENSRPFVFTHVIPGLFNSAIGVFSTGSTYRWVRDHLCQDLVKKAKERGESVYLFMDQEASRSPAGANGLIFHPNLAGGSAVDPGPALRGALLNLDLRHTRADILRAVIEGIAMQQRIALDILKDLASLGSEMIMVGGGSRSPLWRQIHADVYEMRILKSSIDQEAAALGAAGLAAVGAGEWPDFTPIRKIHRIEQRVEPNDENSRMYRRILPIYRSASYFLTDLGERVREL